MSKEGSGSPAGVAGWACQKSRSWALFFPPTSSQAGAAWPQMGAFSGTMDDLAATRPVSQDWETSD